jgi:hypothetical protein
MLLNRGLTPKLLQAQVEQVPEKLQRHWCFGRRLCLRAAGTKIILFWHDTASNRRINAREMVTLPNFGTLPYFVNVYDLLQRLQGRASGRAKMGKLKHIS